MTSSMQAGGKQVSENLTLKTYEKRVKEDIRLIQDNLHEMLKLFRIEDDRTMRNYDEFGLSKMSQSDIDEFEIEIRTCNIVKSMESLTKIVSDLKDLTILNDFKSINGQITNQCNILKTKEYEIDKQLINTKDSLVKLLRDLQHEYYYSNYK